MRIEIPELKRCCFCLPLRRGLLFWVYLKLAFALLAMLFVVISIITTFSKSAPASHHIIQTIVLTVLVMETVFCVVFLNGAHRKSSDHMKFFYKYSIGFLILEIIVTLGFTGLAIHMALASALFIIFLFRYLVEFLCFLCAQIVLQAYLVILVRSEIVKLERSTNFEFFNHTSEPECRAQINV